MRSRKCIHCGKSFIASRSNQQYCTDTTCRRERKREWQREKLQNDPDYRANQREAQARWREKNPGYHRQYRSKNPEYTRKNRINQRIRNRRIRGHLVTVIPDKIAKMDAKVPVFTGIYELSPVDQDGNVIAKMDAKYVQLTVISPVKGHSP